MYMWKLWSLAPFWCGVLPRGRRINHQLQRHEKIHWVILMQSSCCCALVCGCVCVRVICQHMWTDRVCTPNYFTCMNRNNDDDCEWHIFSMLQMYVLVALSFWRYCIFCSALHSQHMICLCKFSLTNTPYQIRISFVSFFSASKCAKGEAQDFF
jgi:hypothetical protein